VTKGHSAVSGDPAPELKSPARRTKAAGLPAAVARRGEGGSREDSESMADLKVASRRSKNSPNKETDLLAILKDKNCKNLLKSDRRSRAPDRECGSDW